ncbi:LuxR C-terminal-related transcriptional regulator [Nonomuraea sp. NPDC048916]|uniref:helix-turn-helix transcriptional regulator n=1 Tax=Nonomuraea sp. NPDC048916 TaxID=3154232 RepID=UPI0033DD8B34
MNGTRADGAAGGPLSLMRAKVRPPRPLRPLVRRPALEERLRAAAAEAVVVLVQGPAGIGKTSLLTTWAAAEAQPVAWLSVDARDNDTARFWTHVAFALAPQTGAPAAPEVPPGSDLFVSALVDRVLSAERRLTLVLDEYEHVTEPQVHQQLDMLIRGCGDRLTTIIASRVRPALPLDRLALTARLAVFTWSDLRMDEDEAERMFAEGFAVRPTADHIAALVRSTDGWAGGLALLGARMRVDAGTALDADAPAGIDLLAEHLLEYVWGTLSPQLREFLLDTAVLERFCAPLAEAVHGTREAGELIDRLRADGVFLLREENPFWFRYHRLFRWTLTRRLWALDPSRARAAHRAAARWQAGHGNAEEAVEHALLGRDYAYAVELIDEVFDEFSTAGHLTTLERWLESLPDTAIPAGLADRALSLWCTLGRPDERDRWSRTTGRHPSADGPVRAPDVWQLCSPREAGDLAVALRHGRQVMERTGGAWSSPSTITLARISVARSLLLAGQPAECRRVLADVEGVWAGSVPPAPLRVAVHALRGLAAYREKDLTGALEQAGLAERARAVCAAPPRPRAIPEYVILQAALATDRPDALDALRELVVFTPGLGPDRSMSVFGLLVLAEAYLNRHDQASAVACTTAADSHLASCPSPLGLVDFRHELAAAIGETVPGHQSTDLLSERERDVLRYLRTDLSLTEIAEHLFVSVNTVKTHARHIYRKLGIAGRHQLAWPASHRTPPSLTRGVR